MAKPPIAMAKSVTGDFLRWRIETPVIPSREAHYGLYRVIGPAGQKFRSFWTPARGCFRGAAAGKLPVRPAFSAAGPNNRAFTGFAVLVRYRYATRERVVNTHYFRWTEDELQLEIQDLNERIANASQSPAASARAAVSYLNQVLKDRCDQLAVLRRRLH